MTDGIVKMCLDFIRWLIMYIKGDVVQKDLTSIYAIKRANLSKPLVGLLEFFEENPDRAMSTTEIFSKWQEKMSVWYGEDRAKEGTTKDGTFYALRDWSNDTEPFIIRVEESNGNAWKISPEYDTHRGHRELSQTIYRMP